jgi:hypothetical protein
VTGGLRAKTGYPARIPKPRNTSEIKTTMKEDPAR